MLPELEIELELELEPLGTEPEGTPLSLLELLELELLELLELDVALSLLDGLELEK